MTVRATLVADIEAPEAKQTPGAIQFDPQKRGLFYVCPCGCGFEGYLPFGDSTKKRPTWQWDGDEHKPSLVPSILITEGAHRDVHWQGHLKKGVFERDTSGRPPGGQAEERQ